MSLTFAEAVGAVGRADDEWMEAIRAAFPGKRAGDVRYTDAANGEPGSELRRRYDAYVEARDVCDAARTERFKRRAS